MLTFRSKSRSNARRCICSSSRALRSIHHAFKPNAINTPATTTKISPVAQSKNRDRLLRGVAAPTAPIIESATLKKAPSPDAVFAALREVYGLQLEVRLESLDAAFAAPARLLEAAEWHLRIDDHAVDRHAARAHAARDLVTALRVRRVDGAVQAVHRAVRLLDGVVEILVRDERHDGPEDFLARSRHLLIDVAEHGRLDEVAAVEAFRPAAAEHELRALGLALADVALHALELPLHRERAHLRRGILRIANFHILDGADVRIEQLVLALLGHEHARQREADLARDRHRVRHEAAEHLTHVGVVEHDRGRLAAELEARAHEALGRDGGDVPARDRRAREADLVDAGMANEIVARLAPGGNHVEDAGRQARGLDALGEDVRVGRRLGRGLRDDRATGGEPGRNLVAKQDERRVPWRDRRDDADRLLDDADEAAVIALALVDERIRLNELAVILEEIGRLIRNVFREADRRADLRRPELRELGLTRAQELRDLQQLGAALRGRDARPPAAVERLPGGCDRTIDVGGRRFRERHDDLFRDRRDDAQAPARSRLLPLTADVEAVRRFDRGFRLALDYRAHRESPCFMLGNSPFSPPPTARHATARRATARRDDIRWSWQRWCRIGSITPSR